MQTLLWSDGVVHVVAAPCVQMLCVCSRKSIFEHCKLQFTSCFKSRCMKELWVKFTMRVSVFESGNMASGCSGFLSGLQGMWNIWGANASDAHDWRQTFPSTCPFPFWLESCPEKTRWMASFYCILFGGLSVEIFLGLGSQMTCVFCVQQAGWCHMVPRNHGKLRQNKQKNGSKWVM